MAVHTPVSVCIVWRSWEFYTSLFGSGTEFNLRSFVLMNDPVEMVAPFLIVEGVVLSNYRLYYVACTERYIPVGRLPIDAI